MYFAAVDTALGDGTDERNHSVLVVVLFLYIVMLKECWCEKWFVYYAIKLDLLKLMGPKNCVVESRAQRALIETTLYLFNCGKHNFLTSYKFITPL